MPPLNLALGTAIFHPAERLQPALDAAKAAGIQEIDTAELYGPNEADLGIVGAADQGFLISSKNPGGWKPGAVREVIPKTSASLERLRSKSLDILYVHGPDKSVGLEEWVPQADELYRQGKFRRFGVSNFSAEEVRAVHAYSKENGYVLPTVYQGNYNAISRVIETTLFPVLRELGIAFYAYSPIAGGFLTKSRSALEEGTEVGRFTKNDAGLAKLYRSLYFKPRLLEGLDKWEEVASLQGVPKAELAYRWVYYHSSIRPELGDTLILGAGKAEQITQTVESLKKGPLKPEVVRGIDEIWELVKEDAFVDNFQATGGKLAS
ncbi:hypothetical protein VPNG_08859 [Cytospora leucostoma]|uniref:NADP-dependent oxidoreductase domain-containing protein n=1 Tax=Cytospora leucostoma TaxID=1230097 RepID=A0A423VRI1_9PEZI|nr:hypothetical protein VPNG_08859 [Cytospora leucostoma]